MLKCQSIKADMAEQALIPQLHRSSAISYKSPHSPYHELPCPCAICPCLPVQTLHFNFFKCTLGASAPNWAVLRECGHEPLHSIGLELPLNFKTACCPLLVPLVSRPFTKTSKWCLGLNLGLWILRASLWDCKAVTHMYKLSCRGTLFVTQISLLN